MSKITRLLLIAVLVSTFASLAGVALAQDDTTAAEQPAVTLYTDYPSQVIGIGETVNLKLKLHSATAAQIVDLDIDDVPDDWDISLRGANRIIQSAYVQPDVDTAIDLKVVPPMDVASGAYQFMVRAQSEEASAELPIELIVRERVPANLAFDIDFPTKRGKPNTTFKYDVTLKNEGDEELQVNLNAEAPGVMIVTFKTSGQEITELAVAANASQKISVEAQPLTDLQTGNYPLTIYANSGGIETTLSLEAEVVGQPALIVTAPDGRLSGDVYAGSDNPIKVILQNTGTAPARGIELTASTPNGWTAEFDPAKIDEVAPGQVIEATANVRPADKSLAGDYMITVRAKPKEGSTKSVDFRMTVRTSTMWGMTGVGLIAAAIVVMGLSVIRFGRR